jgi:hypothetical protein
VRGVAGVAEPGGEAAHPAGEAERVVEDDDLGHPKRGL